MRSFESGNQCTSVQFLSVAEQWTRKERKRTLKKSLFWAMDMWLSIHVQVTTFSVKVGGHGIIFTQSLNFSKDHQQSYYVYARGRYDIWPWAYSQNYAIELCFAMLFVLGLRLGEVRVPMIKGKSLWRQERHECLVLMCSVASDE